MRFIVKLISVFILFLSSFFCFYLTDLHGESAQKTVVVSGNVSSESIEQILPDVSSRSVRADVGKFLLLKSNRLNVALRIIRPTRLNKNKAHYNGAEYECYLCNNEKCPVIDHYRGEVFEPEAGGIADSIYIKCGKIKIEWSISNWIYFNESIYAISRTELTTIEDIKITDTKLKWYYRDKKKAK